MKNCIQLELNKLYADISKKIPISRDIAHVCVDYIAYEIAVELVRMTFKNYISNAFKLHNALTVDLSFNTRNNYTFSNEYSFRTTVHNFIDLMCNDKLGSTILDHAGSTSDDILKYAVPAFGYQIQKLMDVFTLKITSMRNNLK